MSINTRNNEITSKTAEVRSESGERTTQGLYELFDRVIGQGKRVTHQKTVKGIETEPRINIKNIPELRFGFEKGKPRVDLVLNYGDSSFTVDGYAGRTYESWVEMKNGAENGVGFSSTDGVSKTIRIYTLNGI